MSSNNNDIQHKLNTQLKLRYWLSCAIILIILAFMEYDEYTHPTPQLDDVQVDNTLYLIEVMYDFITLCGIWFALKMMKLDFVKRRIKADIKAYYTWACIRETIMFVIIMLGILLHYLTYCPSTLWCSLIAAIATLFVWPTNARWESETTFEESNKSVTASK